MDHSHEAKIYNKQIINNQFSNQLSNLLVNQVPISSGQFKVWDNPPNSAQQTYTLVPTAVAQAYQQLLPLANSLQNATMPISYNNQQNYQSRGISKSAKYRKNKWLKNNSNKQRFVQNNPSQSQISHSLHNSDLRNRIIVRRKSFSATFSDNEQGGYSKNESRSWNDKKHKNELGWEESSIQMNLKPLKLLISSGSESDQWYIVVDTDVILSNFNYLNNMAAADPDCHLLIPHHVMLELQSHALKSSNVQFRRIYRFLTEQIQSGLALLGEELAGEGAFNMAIMTCVKIATQNNNVILISNNPETLKYKSNTKYIHVFTIQEIKDILANKPTRMFRADSPTLALKITVPNDVAMKNKEETDDFLETKLRSTFSSTGQPDSRICTESVIGSRFMEKVEPDVNQSLSSQEDLAYTIGTRNFMRVHSTSSTAVYSRSPKSPMLEQMDFDYSNNIEDHRNPAEPVSQQKELNFSDVYTEPVSRSNFVVNAEIVPVQSPRKRVTHQENINTGFGDRNTLGRLMENTQKNIANEIHATNFSKKSMQACPVEQFKKVCSQSPPKSSKTHQEQINTDIGENKRARSVEPFKIVCSQSPQKTITHQEQVDIDFGDRNIMERIVTEKFKKVGSPPKSRIIDREHVNTVVRPNNTSPPKSRIIDREHVNTVVRPNNTSPPKSRIIDREHVNTVVRPNNTLNHSISQFENRSDQKSNEKNAMQLKEIADSNAGDARTRSEDNFVAYQNPSPSKSASSSFRFFSTFNRDNNSPVPSSKDDHIQSPSKRINRNVRDNAYRSPGKADISSISSSSASSGHVSLDTIRMKSIISMNRLTSTSKAQSKIVTSDTCDRSKKPSEFFQQAVNTAPSVSSSYGSDTSRYIKKVAPNKIVEETSTSDVISNSESSHSEKTRSLIKKDVKNVPLRSVVMYNVSCQSMEDVLRLRCDEWVFRFVQILEEVLQVKLQEKIPFDDKRYPAPRDLQEAARSIIKKFSNNFSVVDAANKLSFILYKTSDEDGKIAVNIQPFDYMEMYSYGVFLVETFQDMCADCTEKDCKKGKSIKPKEIQTDACSCYEVKTASESLKTLLYDIQNCNLESFVDHLRDLSADNTHDNDQTELENDLPEENNEFKEYEDERYNERSPSPPDNCEKRVKNVYNLRSQKRKSENFEDEEIPPKVPVFGEGYESTFFDSLQLQKTIRSPDKIEDHSDVNVLNINRQNNNKPEGHYYSTEPKTTDVPQKQRNFNNLQIHFSKGDFTNAKSQSKVVRKFMVNEDIERKVKARLNESEYENFPKDEENTDAISAASNVNEKIIETNDESKFMCFMGRLARRLGDIFTQVKLLCDEYVKINNLTNATTKEDLRSKMEMAYMLVGNIYGSLDSISKRDLYSDQNVQKLLKIAKVEDYIPDNRLISEYGYMIKICKEKAEQFHSTIRTCLLNMVRAGTSIKC